MESPCRADELNLQGTASLASGDVAGAIADFDRALRVSLPGKTASIHYNRGTARHLAGDLPGAIEDFDRAIGDCPEFAEAYNNRGMTRQLQGDAQGALADFERAIDCAPAYAEAYNNRGMARHARGDEAGAIADFTRAIEFEPRHHRAHNNRGIVLQSTGDLEGAVAEFDRAIALEPRFAEAYGNRGIARQLQACRLDPVRLGPFNDQRPPTPMRGDLDEAIADLSRAVQLAPRPRAAAFHNRGAARQLRGDLRGALNDFDEALAIDPGHFPTYVNRGTAHKALGDLAAARADLDRAVELTLRASAAAAYHNRGGVRVLQNDFAGAIADYDIALEIDPDLLVAYLSRGNARYHLRDPEAFLDHVHVLKRSPGFGVQELMSMFIQDLRSDSLAVFRNCDKHLRRDPGDVTALLRRGLSRLILGRDVEQGRSDLSAAFELRPDLQGPLAPLVQAAEASFPRA